MEYVGEAEYFLEKIENVNSKNNMFNVLHFAPILTLFFPI